MKVLTKAELMAQLQARVDGRQSEGQLACWAFDRFYACELGSESLDPPVAEALAAVLDDLMFAADDPGLAMDDEALRALLKRLSQ